MIVLGLLRSRAGRLVVLVGVLVMLLAVNAAAFQSAYQARLAELRHGGPKQHALPHRPAPTPVRPAPAPGGISDIPAGYLALYRASARTCQGLPWGVLAGIGSVESDHGRSSAPGVRSGVNRFGCCAGPMQFNVRNGPPSTWDRYGRGNVYDPRDAIPAAARLLCANGIGTRAPPSADPCPGVAGTPAQHQAVMAYNQACWYVDQVLTLDRSYTRGGR
jgi:hypothetical protein